MWTMRGSETDGSRSESQGLKRAGHRKSGDWQAYRRNSICSVSFQVAIMFHSRKPVRPRSRSSAAESIPTSINRPIPPTRSIRMFYCPWPDTCLLAPGSSRILPKLAPRVPLRIGNSPVREYRPGSWIEYPGAEGFVGEDQGERAESRSGWRLESTQWKAAALTSWSHRSRHDRSSDCENCTIQNCFRGCRESLVSPDYPGRDSPAPVG